MSRLRGGGALVLALSALALGSPIAAADLRRLESVGVVPVESDASGQASQRELAVSAALARAVEQIARDALPEGFDGGPPPDGSRRDLGTIDPTLTPALGSDPFEYATRFRVMEDRGVGPALLSPGADREYVVLVEVFVDAGRIRERLAEAGWRQDPAGPEVTRVRLILEDLRSFAAYDALRRVLIDELRVRSAIPVELSRGRAVLEVDGDYDSEALLTALMDAAEPGLRVVPVNREAETLTVLVDWTQPPAAPDPGADATGSD